MKPYPSLVTSLLLRVYVNPAPGRQYPRGSILRQYTFLERREWNGLRSFSVSSRSFSENPGAIKEDSEDGRPDLYYHSMSRTLQDASQRLDYAMTYSPAVPPTPSATIIGFIPQVANPDLRLFEENEGFKTLLHETVKRALEDDIDETIRAEAIGRQEGWMHVNDRRVTPALGRINEPEDIIGSVMVQEGKVVKGTYQPMPSYRLLTGDGPLWLPDDLQKRLQDVLERTLKEELTRKNLARGT